jgi:sialic acid synthase SpsE
MIRAIREVEAALGSATKTPSDAELAVRAVARRSVTAARDLAAGEVLGLGDIALLRPASGIAPKHRDELVGRTLARAVPTGTPLQWSDFA